VPNVCVNLVGSRVDSAVLTNHAGEYNFTLPAGVYDLSMTAQPDSLCSVPDMQLAASRTSIQVEGDTSHNHTMESGVLISGVVHDSKKQACAGMQISVYPYINNDGEVEPEKRRSLWDGITGDDGSYEFRLMPDHYWLVLNNQTSTKQKIEISGSQFRNNLIVNDVCILELETVSDDDQPIANCQILVEPFANLKSSTDEPGAYKPELFPPVFTENNGRCSLALPHGSYQPRQIKQLSVGADMSRRIRLEEK
jgi:hypothetical protein